MSVKKWVVGVPDRAKAKILAEECDIDPFVALIANVRGIDDAGELELLLCDEPVLCDPCELADIKIAVFGDYDCDGVVATSLLYDYLKIRGANVVTYIPDRMSEGYGMNCGAIDKLSKEGVKLIITVDNGISCAEEIAYAETLGIKTVVTDHHLPPEKLPDAIAVVDPHRVDCPSSFKEICGAEVAFKLVCVLDDKEPEQMLPRYADILAVATIGDVMPLVNENRSIVKIGIQKIKNSPSVGISAILNSAGIDRKEINAGKISFGIVPRINAAGRMGSAFRAFKLLTSENMIDALNLAAPIDDDNTLRQRTEKEIYNEAVKIIEANGYHHNRVIVVCGENWHFGVLGIAAARICERYGKPAIVLSNDDGVAHGSGRSFSGFHLYNAINACANSLLKYGGHELAAGVSVLYENVDDFRKNINEYALSVALAIPQLNLDCRINPAAMNIDMAFAIKALEPFGLGNPTPIFGIFEVTLQKITPIGSGKHLKLLCRKGENVFQSLIFGVTVEQFAFCAGDVIDLAVTLDTNLYQGQYNMSVIIKAIRLSTIDDDAYFLSKSKYDDYASGYENDYESLFADRDQVGEVYRLVKSAPINKERVLFLMAEKLGFAKTQIALSTLLELGLIDEKDGSLVSNETKQKTDLLSSNTYKTIYEGVKGNE